MQHRPLRRLVNLPDRGVSHDAVRASDPTGIGLHSTVDEFNGADLGIREEWVPLFDEYGVDLVVCGHEHHYERSHPIRGRKENATLTPVPAAPATDAIDTTKGTVHMVIGGGGTSIPSNRLFFDPPQCRVITAVGEAARADKRRPSLAGHARHPGARPRSG
jgi:hypothetical protein